MVLNCCKWDPQVGDVATLAPFPLLIGRAEWQGLCSTAEALARELIAAEAELLGRPDLHRTLAVPRPLRSVLRDTRDIDPTPAAVRTLRFDFHWTTDGWRISEVNSDVPGGFAEASELTRLFADHGGASANLAIPGDPAAAWADAVAAAAGVAPVALLSAPGFMEDFQVVSYMATRLAERGVAAHLAAPSQIAWDAGHARLRAAWYDGPVGAVVRFFQAEWMARLPQCCNWRPLVAGGRTPVTNPGTSVLTESKRFPLAWEHFVAALPTWRRTLPETRDPRAAPWRRDDGWLLKSAFCNTGDTVAARDLVSPQHWRSAARGALLWPGHWVAQRRFEMVPVRTPFGDVYPCVGVYTIDGRACGAYTRIAMRAVIDYRAVDVALLVEGDTVQEAPA
jgi:glutathionylspermidine synthase